MIGGCDPCCGPAEPGCSLSECQRSNALWSGGTFISEAIEKTKSGSVAPDYDFDAILDAAKGRPAPGLKVTAGIDAESGEWGSQWLFVLIEEEFEFEGALGCTLNHVDFCVDHKGGQFSQTLNGVSQPGSAFREMVCRWACKQSGKLYVETSTSPAFGGSDQASWATKTATGFTSSSFSEVTSAAYTSSQWDSASHPDFSDGDPVQFGLGFFIERTAATGEETLDLTTCIDNLCISFGNTCPMKCGAATDYLFRVDGDWFASLPTECEDDLGWVNEILSDGVVMTLGDNPSHPSDWHFLIVEDSVSYPGSDRFIRIFMSLNLITCQMSVSVYSGVCGEFGVTGCGQLFEVIGYGVSGFSPRSDPPRLFAFGEPFFNTGDCTIDADGGNGTAYVEDV